MIKSGNIGSAWACLTHVRDLNSCPLKSIPDTKIRAAFTTMLNKLIFSRRQLMELYLSELENWDDNKINRAIEEVTAEYSSALEQQKVITKLGMDGVLDPTTYQSVLNKLDAERRELSNRKEMLTLRLRNRIVYCELPLLLTLVSES